MLLILVSYMMRLKESDDPVLAGPKEKILKLSPALIEMLLDTAQEIQKAIQQGAVPPTKLSTMSIMQIIEFSQNMAQGTFDHDSPYIQLPRVTAAQAKELTKKVKEFKDFVKMKPEERKKLALFEDAK